VFAEQRADGEHQLSLDGLEFAAVDVDHFADMSYVGQIHRLRVAVGAGDDADRLRERFVAQYRTEYGTELGDLDVVVVNARTVVSGRRAATAGAPGPPATDTPEPRAHRRVCFQTWVDAPVYAREDLLPGSMLAGPMIVEQADTTVVIEPDMDVTVDPASNLIVRRR
jgi:N-methylhydantoinase A